MNPFDEQTQSEKHEFFSQMTKAINEWMLNKYPEFDTLLLKKIEELTFFQREIRDEFKKNINHMKAEKESQLTFFKEEINKFLSKEHPGVASKLCNLAGDLEALAKKEISIPVKKILDVTVQNKEFLTPRMLVEDPSCPFSEKALRFHIWRSGVNGLAPAIYRIGKKILIKRSEWLKWLESHAQRKKKGI